MERAKSLISPFLTREAGSEKDNTEYQ